MIRRPPRSTRTDTLFPDTTLFRSTAEEVPLLAAAKDIATMEVTPQHLTLAAPYCYEELGSFAQMNPPIRDARHREALWEAVRLGIADVVGSDHAPHSREEKAAPYPRSPSGMRSEEHTSELQSLMRISYAVFCLKKKKNITTIPLDNDTRKQ